MIAGVAAENLDRGADRQRGEFGQLFHDRAAFFTAAHGVALIRRIGRNIRIARRHHVPPLCFFESLRSGCHDDSTKVIRPNPAGERGGPVVRINLVLLHLIVCRSTG